MGIEDLRATYAGERAGYQELVSWMESIIEHRLERKGFKFRVDGRAKSIASFLLKARGPEWTGKEHEIPDLAGVRVVVPGLQEATAVQGVIEDDDCPWTVVERIDKAAELRLDQLGYLGVHYRVVPVPSPGVAPLPTLDRPVEIQIHTTAQTAWADISHPFTYKPQGVEPNAATVRRINRLIALVEIFDQEVEEARTELMRTGDPAARLFYHLQQAFLDRVVTDDYEPDVSLEILGLIQDAFTPDEIEMYTELLLDVLDKHDSELTRLYSDLKGQDYGPALLFHPVGLAIIERMEHRPMLFADVWRQHFDDGLANELGLNFGLALA